jgi:hypothetical protein
MLRQPANTRQTCSFCCKLFTEQDPGSVVESHKYLLDTTAPEPDPSKPTCVLVQLAPDRILCRNCCAQFGYGEGHDRKSAALPLAEQHAKGQEPDPPLSPLCYDILQSLRALKATDSDKRATASQIAHKVGGDATEQSCKGPVADLKRRGFVNCKTGRHGGSWLTPEGQELIDRVRKP